MRTHHMRAHPPAQLPPFASPVPLLDASSLPAEEDWHVVESFRIDPDAGADPVDDSYAGVGIPALAFDD
jgi:hypothetical protein